MHDPKSLKTEDSLNSLTSFLDDLGIYVPESLEYLEDEESSTLLRFIKKARYVKFMKKLTGAPSQSLDAKEVWRILSDSKSASDAIKLKEFLNDLGVYDAADVDYLDDNDESEITIFLKPVISRQLKKKFAER